MRVESEYNRRPDTLCGLRFQCLNDGRMPEVHAVKVADRQRTSPKLVRECIDLTKDFHVGGFGEGGGWGVETLLSMRFLRRASVSIGLTVFR